MTSTSKAPAVARAAALLRRLGERSGEGVNALARAVGMSPSSCFNILKTLVAEELVDFDADTKTYALGAGAVALARRALDPADAFQVGAPMLERLADQYGGTVVLFRVTRDKRLVLIGRTASEAGASVYLGVGQRLPRLMGAAGRCVAAFADIAPAEIAEEFALLRWEAPPSLARYRREVEEARQRGWSLDEDCYVRGVTTVAAPVLGPGGVPHYCLGVSDFSGRHGRRGLARIGADAAKTGRQIAQALYGSH